MPNNTPIADQFWLLTGNTPTGPFTVAQIHAKLASGEATWQTQACLVGGGKWLPLMQTPWIGPQTATSAEPLSTPPTSEVPDINVSAPTIVSTPATPATLATSRVFHFLSGVVVTDVEGFIRACRDYPTAAATQLRSGEFGPWLTSIGEPGLASLSETARTYHPSAETCLVYFLAKADPTQVEPVPPANAVNPSLARVIVGVLVIGLLGWGGYVWLRPLTATEVCKKLDQAKTAADAKKYATARMHPCIDSMLADKSVDPNDTYEWTQEIDGPQQNTKLVGLRGTVFVQEAGKRLRVEGHCKLVKSDGWKVDDLIISGVEGTSLPGPFSLVDEHYHSAANPNSAPGTNSLPPNTAKPVIPPSSAPKKRSELQEIYSKVENAIGVGGIVAIVILVLLAKAVYDSRSKKPAQS